MTETLKQFLQSIAFIEIADIKRHARGLLKALENSNRKEMLEYTIKQQVKCEHKHFIYGTAQWCEDCERYIDFQEE